MTSDLNKHEETRGHVGIELGIMELMAGFLDTSERMRRHIEGYN